MKNIKDSNYIISKIDIEEEDVNKEIRIFDDSYYDYDYSNEKHKII